LSFDNTYQDVLYVEVLRKGIVSKYVSNFDFDHCHYWISCDFGAGGRKRAEFRKRRKKGKCMKEDGVFPIFY